METPRVNVADSLAEQAALRPDTWALINTARRRRPGPYEMIVCSGDEACEAISYAQLHREAETHARGLVALGVEPGTRIALLVKPSIEFVTLVFALLRSGATMVLVDSGLGRNNIVRCLASTEPEGFVAIPLGHALRIAKRREFSKARLNVNVGPSWMPLGKPLAKLRALGESSSAELPHTTADDPAAIVFTSGSTGPPKGVVYRHETFTTQLAEIQRIYDLEPGGVDLACFPLFGLFNVAMGITTVLPEMDFSRPAQADPRKLLAAANDFQVTQSFASPAVWDKLSRHCEQTGKKIPTLKKVFSCGAPVGADVIRRTLEHVCPGAELHTPYGATESLPVSTIEGQEILGETQARTEQGAGVCVGRKVDSIEWRIIKITDEPIATIEETEELPTGEIGELIVRGPQVSRQYLDSEPRPSGSDHNASAKIADNDTIWHRMGDVGYLDEHGRFWYCGRKSQRVETSDGPLYTECVEHFFNSHSTVGRSALVRVDGKAVLVVAFDRSPISPEGVLEDLSCCLQDIGTVLHYRENFPTDIRHNAKINREKLAKWAVKQLKKQH